MNCKKKINKNEYVLEDWKFSNKQISAVGNDLNS